MKNTIIAFLMILLPLAAMATEYHVGDGFAYATIQAAINASSSGDIVVVHSDGDDNVYSENLQIQWKAITLKSDGIDEITLSVSSGVNIAMQNINVTSDLVIQGFVIENTGSGNLLNYQGNGTDPYIKVTNCSLTGSGGILINLYYSNNVLIENCEFDSDNESSALVSISRVHQTNTIIRYNLFRNADEGALSCIDAKGLLITQNVFVNCDKILNCVTGNRVTGLNFNKNLIYDCDSDSTDIILRLHSSYADLDPVVIENNTLYNDSATEPILLHCQHGAYGQEVVFDYFRNNIFRNFSEINVPAGSNLSVDYCCYDAGITIPAGMTGSGNTNADPQFTDVTSDDYSLKWTSPCIDTGDPATGADSDGSIIDIGYKYFKQDVYNWSQSASERVFLWRSFPRLKFTGDQTNHGQHIDAEYVFESWNPQPTGFIAWQGNEGISWVSGTYDEQNGWDWDYPTRGIYSTLGYKMQRNGTGYPKLFSRGLLCEDDTDLNTTAETTDWLGYFLPGSQLVLNAFPQDVLDDAIKIWTQSWCISRSSTNDPWSGTPASCKINYKDCVLITTVDNNHTFEWEPLRGEEEPEYRPFAEHFSFIDQIEYHPVYVHFDGIDLPQEVAIFVNGVCRGAEVVQDTICQICSYILEEELGEQIEFAFWYDDRNIIETNNRYLVFNDENGEFEQRSLLTGMPGIHYEVRFTTDYQEVTPPQYDLHCYPNPFNPELTISFSLEETQPVKLEIFNIRGQKVKNLVNETFRPDQYHVIWNGEDYKGEKVSSGAYYIRLQVGDDIVNDKVILMK